MKSILVLIGTVTFALASIQSVCADMPWGHARRPIIVPAENEVGVIVEADDAAKEPRLFIPKSLAHRARPVKTASAPSPTQSGVGPAILLPVGGAMALAYFGVGVCLVSGRAVSRKLILLLALAGGGATAVWANPPQRKIEYRNGLSLDGVAVEFVDQGDTIRLILPRSMVAEMAGKLHAVENKANGPNSGR